MEAWSPFRFVVCSVLLSLGLSLGFFSPKLWLMDHPRPGSFEWERALTYLHQCRDPFDHTVEAAMRWRLLPPLVAHGLGLSSGAALAVPYVGLVALLATWCSVASRLLHDRFAALALTIILGTTGAVLSITAMLGLNDAWFLLGLVAVSAGSGPASLILPGLLAPWVDERFLLGWPAALYCRWWLEGRPPRYWSSIAIAAASLLPYVMIRGTCMLFFGDPGSVNFVAGTLAMVPSYLPYGRLGWWMGFRAAWILLLCCGYAWWRDASGRNAMLGPALALAGWIGVTLVASDITRSTNLLLPLLLGGALALQRAVAGRTAFRLWLSGIAAANLTLPYLAVIYDRTALLWSLPTELLRLYKGHS